MRSRDPTIGTGPAVAALLAHHLSVVFAEEAESGEEASETDLHPPAIIRTEAPNGNPRREMRFLSSRSRKRRDFSFFFYCYFIKKKTSLCLWGIFTKRVTSAEKAGLGVTNLGRDSRR